MLGKGWKLVSLILLGVSLGLFLQLRAERASYEKMSNLRNAEAESHRATKAYYRRAAEQSARMAAERVERVKAVQAVEAQRAKEVFDTRLTGLRSTYERMLREGRGTASSAGGASALPTGLSSAPGVDEATGSNGLSLAERYECSVYATQLDELITSIENSAKVK